MELSGRDEEVAERLRRDYRRRLEIFRAAFEAAQRAGEIAPDRDARALAHFVIASISGMRVSAPGGGRPAMEAIADTVVRAL
ncbi:TetR family transcriptional regulator C-terminal domain-containing protein [Streptomyces sp. M19]